VNVRFFILALLLTACQPQPTFHDAHGKQYRLQDFHDQWILLNYWASWCPSCVHEVSIFNHLAQRDEIQPLLVVGINYDIHDDEKRLATQVDKHQIHYPVLLEDLGKFYKVAPIRGLPTTVLINPKGQAIKTFLGEQNENDLVQAIATLQQNYKAT
jgi:thiol-disulfide isomerase/thioredoxin